MKRKTIRIFAIAVALLMTVQIPLTSFAFDNCSLTENQWKERYDSLRDENTLPLLCVGSDETELNLTWHAKKEKAVPKVRVAKNPAMDNAITFEGETVPSENDSQLVCRATVMGIKPNTAYWYQWYSENGWSKAYKYESKGTETFKMMVVGDIQIGGQSDDNPDEQARVGYVWQSLLDEALTENPDISFLLSPGDNTSTGAHADEWQTLMMPEYLRSLPVALAIGNHDKKGMTYNYYTNMPNEYFGKYFEGLDRDFWFTYGNVLFMVFDATSADAYDHEAMAQEAVEANPDCKWRIAVMHQALYGAGPSVLEPETMILLNGMLQPIFTMYDVDYVFTGHSHAQARSHFIKSGVVIGKAESGKTYTNPEGIIYQNCNACCDQWGTQGNPFCAFTLEDEGYPTYTTVEFSDDKMDVKTFRGDNSELLDSITIVKTRGFHDSRIVKLVREALYSVVKVLGLVYMRGDAITVKIRGGHF